MRKDVTLSNGRIVTHKAMDNGATEALMLDGGEMSDSEWNEYAQTINKLDTPPKAKKLTWAEIKAAMA
jgi:hypothetical protein